MGKMPVADNNHDNNNNNNSNNNNNNNNNNSNNNNNNTRHLDAPSPKYHGAYKEYKKYNQKGQNAK